MAGVNVTIRVDEEVKRQFDEFCENVGMNITTAYNLFMRETLRTRRLPFTITDISQEKADALSKGKEALKDAQEQARLNGTNNMTMDEIDAEIAAYREEKRGL